MLLHVIEVHLLHCWLVFNYMDIPEVVLKKHHQAMQAWNFPNFLMRKKKKKKSTPWHLEAGLALTARSCSPPIGCKQSHKHKT